MNFSRVSLKYFAALAWCALIASSALRAEVAATAEQKTTFREALDSAIGRAEGGMSVAGLDGWYFFDKELKHLASGRYWGDLSAPNAGTSDPLPAILDFKAQLDKAGVELIVVPVPAKAAVYPDKLSAAFSSPPSTPTNLAEQDAAFIEALTSNGVRVLDLTGDFLKARAEGLETHCRTDTHWSPEGIRLAAEKTATLISKIPWAQEQARLPFSSEPVEIQIHGDLAPAGAPQEALPARRVTQPGGSGSARIPDSRNSPIVLLGDSHNLVFHSGGEMHATGAGLPDQLGMALGFPIDVVAVMGSGSTAARRSLARRKDNLAGKKLVIWCFSAREFTQGQGWAKVRVVKGPEPSPISE
jgi:alginate O-acetyltransferase complex protein AlgJ